MLKFGAAILAFLIALYAGACGYLYFKQRSFLYFPPPARMPDDGSFIRLHSGDHELKIWKLGDGAEAILYFGGNAEDVAHNLPAFATSFPGKTVYLVNYRGYAGNPGSPSEAALFQDAVALYDMVQARHTHIAAVGRSLGSGVAVYLSTQRQLEKIVLITPYDSIASVAQRNFPVFPVSLLLKDRYDSVSRAAAIRIPVLIMVASHDEVIPRPHTDRLIAALSGNNPTVEVFQGMSHNSIDAHPDYWKKLQAFLAR